MSSRRASVAIAMIGVVAVALGGCASSGIRTSNIATESITPIQNTPVASSNLPAIGQDGQVQTADIGTPGQPTDLEQPAALDPALPPAVDQFGQPVQVASTDDSFVTLDAVGAVPNTPGRDLSGGLTIEKLLGGWTIVSGAEQCKLNLTYTAKTGTSRYRASTPGCGLAGLKVVASWQLVGTQVQLFDEAGDIIASLILSGNRFIGTLAGGQGISMVG
ncbi:AprI/Inh family metalloprotease inhibitor [Devosia sp.]|uniref:AprI/Inh family metalloprotease inhibitor n=1 Tax=Devosia sp. TaxID=1871048 RepID=UPI0035ADBBC8